MRAWSGQEAAGICVLPLGQRVLRKICEIIREEQNARARSIVMPTLQSADLWRERALEDYGKEMLRSRTGTSATHALWPDQRGDDYGHLPRLRALIRICRSISITSMEVRDELRPRFGLMRGREFLMKDAYSFDVDFAGAKRAYNRMFVAYLRTFARMGLKAIPCSPTPVRSAVISRTNS